MFPLQQSGGKDFTNCLFDLKTTLLIVLLLQELEQEKYHLRRRLEGVEEEYDLKVNELTTDISSLRGLLQQTETHNRQAEREKSLLITQLTEQNQRLTSQLKDVSTMGCKDGYNN